MRPQHSIKARLFAAACIMALITATIPGGAARAAVTGGENRLALGVSPALTELVLERGKTSKTTVVVSNITNEPIPVKGFVNNFVPLEAVANKHLPIYDASQWFTLSEPAFVLYPKENKHITISVAAPATAEPGGHYATVFFQPAVAASSLKPNTSYAGTKVGINTFLIVKGSIRESLTVTEPSASFINERGPVAFTFDVTNTGNVHIMPTASLDIYNFRARRIASLPIKPMLILPHTTRTVSVTWDNHGQRGRFLAKLDLTYGTQKQRQTSRYHSFWVAPFLRFGVWALILAIGILIAWSAKGRWRRAVKALLKPQ